MATSKRQASNFDARDADFASNKRRRQQDELQYAVATIRTALADVGRPHMAVLSNRRERALPLGSVNMELAKAMTSSEYDRQEAEMATAVPQDQEPGNGCTDKTDDDSHDLDDDVSSMYMMASLIQSTRHYYSRSVASDDHDTTVNSDTTLSNAKSSQDESNITQAYIDYNKNHSSRKAPSEDNSEGRSTWTPASSYGDWNDNNRKNIDNDNRSDEQSSCGIGYGDESSSNNSISDFAPEGGSSSPRCSPCLQGKTLRSGSSVGKTSERAFFIVG